MVSVNLLELKNVAATQIQKETGNQTTYERKKSAEEVKGLILEWG